MAEPYFGGYSSRGTVPAKRRQFFGSYRENIGDEEFKNKSNKKKADDALKEAERQAKAKKDEGFNPLKFAVDISRPVSQGGANVFADAGNFVEESGKEAYKKGETFLKQGYAGIKVQEKGASGLPQSDKLLKLYKQDLKKGDITKKQYDEVANKIQKRVRKNTKAVEDVKKETGIEYDSKKGELAAIETIANLSGTGALAKWFGKKALKTGKDLVKSVGKKDTPTKSVTTKDKILGSKPAEFFFGDKDSVIDAAAKVKKTDTPQRARRYQIEVNKPRVTPKEAEQKLKRAGYTTDESKKILEDVLPEKGLSMPGSPKKVGYKEDNILAAANDFDNVPPIGEVKKSAVVDETAANYNTVDDYINEAVDRTWADNKKGAGTTLVNKSLNEKGVGSDALQATRGSDNNPYYRAVFEETGRAPTKTRIREDITDFLNGKNNAAKWILDPDERGVIDLIKERQTGIALKTDAPEGAIVSDGSNLTPLASKTGTEKGTSKLAASTKQEALKDKLIKKTQADTVDTPQYNKANMEQQADYATNLIKTNPEDAIDIAMGRKAPPEHILQQMVYNAVEDHAKKIGGDKGANLLLQLSRSRQSTNLTKMGQEIRAAAERDPHSPVTLMDEVKLARAEAAKKRGKDLSKAVKTDTAAVKKVTPKVKKETWDSFVKELEC